MNKTKVMISGEQEMAQRVWYLFP